MNRNSSTASHLRSVSLREATDRSCGTAVLPDDVARFDSWPDWSASAEDSAEVARRADENAPGRVLFEAGLVLGVPLALAVVVTLLAPIL